MFIDVWSHFGPQFVRRAVNNFQKPLKNMWKKSKLRTSMNKHPQDGHSQTSPRVTDQQRLQQRSASANGHGGGYWGVQLDCVGWIDLVSFGVACVVSQRLVPRKNTVFILFWWELWCIWQFLIHFHNILYPLTIFSASWYKTCNSFIPWLSLSTCRYA